MAAVVLCVRALLRRKVAGTVAVAVLVAVAGASVVVLSYLFPTKVQMLEDMVTAQANAGPGQPHSP